MNYRVGEMLPRALLVAATVIAACAPTTTGLLKQPPVPGWPDAGTPPATMAAAREVRVYRDDKGVLWDDTGNRVGSAP